jgi:hypothetical protein
MEDPTRTPTLVDMNNWEFVFKSYSPVKTEPDRRLSFPTAFDLAKHLADDDQDAFTVIHSKIEKRLDLDPVVRNWSKDRSLLKNLEHFPRYRRKHYDTYHAAARALAAGTAAPTQESLVRGLQSEIDASRTIARAGQVLFHGRADQELTNGRCYPSFISTSLNLVVARNSAFRRASKGGSPTLYIITLQSDMPTLWGQAGKSCEYEVLLPRGLKCERSRVYKGSNFEVVEANAFVE